MAEKIKITFLGTSQAIPTAKRNHTSILLTYKDQNILIDCGEGTQRQFRKAKLNPCKLTKILITHWHRDHILGIPGLLQTLSLNNYSKTLEIYGPKGTKKYLNLMYKLFVHKNKIKIKIKEISKSKFLETPDFYIESFPMTHNTPCNSYRFVEKAKTRFNKSKLSKLALPSKLITKLAKGKTIKHKGKTIKPKNLTYQQPGKTISIILDTSINKNCISSAKNADLLIAESTYSNSELNLAEKYFHLTTSQAALIAKKAKAKKLILTHLSQRYQKNELILLKEAKKIFKQSSLADDLDILEI